MVIMLPSLLPSVSNEQLPQSLWQTAPQLPSLSSSPQDSVLIQTPLLEMPFTARNLLNATLGIFFSGSHLSFPETRPLLCSLSRNLSSSDSFSCIPHVLPSYLLTKIAAAFPGMLSLAPPAFSPETTCCVLHSPNSLPFPLESPSGRLGQTPIICFSVFLLSVRLYSGDYWSTHSFSIQSPICLYSTAKSLRAEPEFHSLWYLQ